MWFDCIICSLFPNKIKWSFFAIWLWVLLFLSSLLQVDTENTVGKEAFSRIAPAIPTIADVITSSDLFNVLTASTRDRLSFSVYEKYLCALERLVLFRWCLAFFSSSVFKFTSDLPLKKWRLQIFFINFLRKRIWFYMLECILAVCWFFYMKWAVWWFMTIVFLNLEFFFSI